MTLRERREVHPSHKIELRDDGPDYHDYQLECTVCHKRHCSMCVLYEDDDLTEPCIGFPWYEGVYDSCKLIGRKSG